MKRLLKNKITKSKKLNQDKAPCHHCPPRSLTLECVYQFVNSVNTGVVIL